MRDLVYLCVFYNKKFIDMFRLFLESYVLYENHKIENMDLLVLTNIEFKDEILKLGEQLNVNILVQVVESKGVFDSKIARLRIFDFETTKRYKRILYLDTDILLSGNLVEIFKNDLKLDEKLYVVREGDIGNNYHGKFLFDSNLNQIDYKRPAFNSGVLLFKNCETIKNLFKVIKSGILEYADTGVFLSHVDQPFFNYYTLKSNLEEMIYLHELSTNNPNGRNNHVICHFAGNDDGNKYLHMKKKLEILRTSKQK